MTKIKKPSSTYNIHDLEKSTGIASEKLRLTFRKAGFKKQGGRWAWSTKAQFNDMIKYLEKNHPNPKTRKKTI